VARQKQTLFALTPHWYGGELAPDTLDLSPDLRQRLREWNRTWMEDLNPEVEIRWPDLLAGRAWASEGRRLVEDLQSALGSGYRVVSGFEAYDPDSPGYEGILG